jgi:DNA-directed RNA polymerase specialized sigma subunit
MMSSSLEKALERFDKLSERQLSQIARRMIRGAVRLEEGKRLDCPEVWLKRYAVLRQGLPNCPKH